MDKKITRLRRSKKARAKIREMGVHRLCVHRTPRHIYTLDAVVKGGFSGIGNVVAATLVGKMIAEKARAAGITKIAFDRSGFKYHGRVKALADAAREHGLEF